MFAKNGNDVTTLALTVARAQTGKKTVLVQPQGYHGAGPVWTKERLKFYLDPAMQCLAFGLVLLALIF